MRQRANSLLLPAIAVALFASAAALAADEIGRYQTRAEFLLESLGTDHPSSAVIWIDDELRAAATEILGHSPGMLRVRYWYTDAKTAWIIDEIGKEQPITFGLVVEDAAIQALHVMQFRETRGWEIRYPFFTGQFAHLRLTDRGTLSHGIDGISGATLSVKAATRSAKFALMLDAYTRRSKLTAAPAQ